MHLIEDAKFKSDRRWKNQDVNNFPQANIKQHYSHRCEIGQLRVNIHSVHDGIVTISVPNSPIHSNAREYTADPSRNEILKRKKHSFIAYACFKLSHTHRSARLTVAPCALVMFLLLLVHLLFFSSSDTNKTKQKNSIFYYISSFSLPFSCWQSFAHNDDSTPDGVKVHQISIKENVQAPTERQREESTQLYKIGYEKRGIA